MPVREVRFQVAEPGCRVQTLVVVTTLVDADAYGKEDLGELYRERWQVELDIRSLKVGLQMDRLREFDLTRLPSADEEIYLFKAAAKSNKADERLIAPNA